MSPALHETELRPAVPRSSREHWIRSSRPSPPIGMARLRYTAVERHVGMHPQPIIGIPRKHQGGPAGAGKRTAIGMIARARPRCDHSRHHAIRGSQNRGLLKDETEVGEQRPCRGVVDLTDIAREDFQPLAEELRDLSVRGRQRFHCLLHIRRPNGGNFIAMNRSGHRLKRGVSADQKNQFAAKVAGFAYPVRGHGFAEPIACHFRRTDGP
jgi:hypothetical protein